MQNKISPQGRINKFHKDTGCTNAKKYFAYHGICQECILPRCIDIIGVAAARRDMIKRELIQGHSIESIIDKYDISYMTVTRICKDMNQNAAR